MRFAELRPILLGLAGVIAITSAAAAQTAKPASTSPVTFTKDVAPILQRSCQKCHRPGSIAPMSLLTYQDARPWARSIKREVEARNMPPWHVARGVGITKFKNDPSLSDEEIATIVKWVDAGAPQGNPGDMPPPVEFKDDNAWSLGTPDVVVTSVKHQVPAAGSDWWGDYIIETNLTEDRWLRAVEAKPGVGNKQVTHHLVGYLMQDDDTSVTLAGRDGGAGGEQFLVEYAVGKNADIFPGDTGRLVKAGAKIRFNMHYHPIGEAKSDASQIALYFYPKGYTPKYYYQSSHTGDNDDMDLPAGVDNIRTEGYSRLNQNARVTAFQPHLHNRGKAQCMQAIYPDGKMETISCVDRYKFGWHIVYNYADDAAPLLPKGTILKVTSWHNNTSTNLYNPDPQNWAGFGQRSIDDMSFAWVSYVWLDDEEFAKQVADRAKTRTPSTNTQQQQQQ
jgi:hypothetical protein